MQNLSGKILKWRIRSDMEQEERFLNLIFLSMYGVNYLVEMILCLICSIKLFICIEVPIFKKNREFVSFKFPIRDRLNQDDYQKEHRF